MIFFHLTCGSLCLWMKIIVSTPLTLPTILMLTIQTDWLKTWFVHPSTLDLSSSVLTPATFLPHHHILCLPWKCGQPAGSQFMVGQCLSSLIACKSHSCTINPFVFKHVFKASDCGYCCWLHIHVLYASPWDSTVNCSWMIYFLGDISICMGVADSCGFYPWSLGHCEFLHLGGILSTL